MRAAFVTLAIIALLLFAKPLLNNEVLTLRDHSDYFQPLRLFTNQELRRGHLPLWNPYNASGEPWLANPQTGVFYPPAWIFVVVPFARAYVLYLAMHVALLGCGALLLFRRFSSPQAAFLGALTLMLCGPTMSLLDINNTLTTFAWIPIVLWCALAEAPPAVCAVAIAMSFLAGEPFFAALAALMFALVWCAGSQPAKLLDIALTSFALTAVQLLPFLGWIRGSDRAGGLVANEILRDSMPVRDWLHVFFSGSTAQSFIPVVYVGLTATVLAVLALATSWRRRAVIVAFVALVISAVIAAGAYFTPVAFVLTHLRLAIFRYPARLIPIGAIAIAALAAAGYDSLTRALGPRRWLPFVLTALIIADLTPRIAPLLQSGPFDPHPTPYDVGFARDAKLIRVLAKRAFDRREWIAGYMNLFERRFDSWTASPVVDRRYIAAYEEAMRDPKQRHIMSIGYVLSDRAGKVAMYREPRAYPLAYWRGDDGAAAGPSLIALTTSEMHVTVDAPRDGTVVITQQQSSGWRATVDGVRAEPLRDEMFCAVRVKQGHHDVAWRYRPSSFVVGAFITLAGILRVALSTKFVKRRGKKIFFAMLLQAS
jgi:hypothetical protein